MEDKKPVIAVVLSGCGVFDGAEIHESVLSLLEIEQNGGVAKCYAPDMEQYHVLDHTSGEEMDQKRNVLIESSRIARGDITPLKELNVNDVDGIMLPGGFGAAKNLTEWAFSGPEGNINQEVKRVINDAINSEKPIGAVCMGPTVVAKALQNTDHEVELTIGTTESSSPYDINGIAQGVEATGAKAVNKEANEVQIDEKHKIFTSPCYNMEASITDVHKGIQKTVKELLSHVKVPG
ncbi:MAG: isoprenoid biosynthesis glyoxalase ElbB [Flavobacteriales bacterium]